MTPPRYRTDYRLWLAVGVCVFVALGFYDPSGGRAKGSASLWMTVPALVAHWDHPDAFGVLVVLACCAAFLAGAAALVGWAVQAVVVLRSRRTATG